MNDEKIIALYFSRDELAIKETKNKYERLCAGISRKILQNESDVEECLNDTYLGVWNAIPPARPKSLKAFVAGIARNLSLKRWEYNSAQKRGNYELVEFSEVEHILSDREIGDSISNDCLASVISDFLRTLPEDVANVFVRKYWYFDTIAEIAQRYGFGESRVKSILARTQKRLKSYLIERGIRG